MKLSYWYAECIDGDSDCYSIIAKTKKVCIYKVSQHWEPHVFARPINKTIIYKDAFDLFSQATDEGGGRRCGEDSRTY